MKPGHLIAPLSSTDGDAHGQGAGVLEVNGLGLYDRDRWLWRGLGFTLAPGERLALSGPSGSGKSALLRSLAGLIPATEGDIRFRNRSLADWPMPLYRSSVGYLPQRPMLSDGETVEAVLSQPFGYRAHRAKGFPREQVLAQLQLLGRDGDFLRRPVESLSGGEQQIVALLRLLALGPSLLLLDEATASLDRMASLAVESLLNDWLARQPESALLWVGHDAEQAARLSDRHLEVKWNP